MDEELLTDFDSFTTPQETLIAETAPIETPIAEPTIETPAVIEPTAAPEADQTLSDFDTFTQPQFDPIEKHRPQNIDDNSWMDIKERVSKFLGEYTPIAAIPKMATEFLGEVQQKEGSQVAEAMSVKSRLENIDFAYSDLADTLKAATGDKESEEALKTKQNKLNDEVVGILEERGIEAFNDNGKLMVVTKDEDGNDVLNDLDDEILDSVLGGFKASAGEIGGAIIGAVGGATMAQRTLPLTAPLPTRATAGLVGASIGGYTGATAGRATDLIRNAISLNKEIDAREVFQKSLEAGTADVAGAAAVGLVAKGVSKALAPIGKVSDRLKTLFKEGNIQAAKKVVKDDYGLTDQNIDTLFENVKKDIVGLEDLTGDDLLRAKLTAAIQQQPQGKALITAAIRNNAKAAIETSKEIDFRAKQVMQSANQFSKKPSKIKKSIEAYEKAVGKNYGEVRGLIDEALPNYKYSLKAEDFDTTLRDLETRVIDPLVKDKMTNLINVVSQKMDGNVADLIDLRQMVNKFYSKNQSAFELKPDKEALFNIQKTIDGKLDEAINSVDDGGIISSQLRGAFKDAKAKYAKMFKTQDTASYNAIFRKGASEDDIGKALVKYSKATDGDLESVLGKLSPVQRTKSEFSIIKQMVDSATAKGEAKAIDFAQLLEDVGTSKAIFKTPEAKQFLKNIESYDKKFGKDIDIQKIAAGVAPKVEKNIATSLVGKIIMKISALRFEALQRMLPTETGRRLSLQKSIESALEKSRTPREFFFEASKIKGMPNKERISLKKAVKEIGEKEELLKKQMVDQQEKNRKAVQEAQIKKEEVKAKKILTEQEFKKVKWEKAKEAAKKQKLSEQAMKVKEASVVPIGGSEEEAKQAVKNVFAKSQESKYKGMSKADIKELERIEAEEASQVFAKFGDNIAAGTIAGVEEDEKGNITFDPQKFVMGLGGYTAVKAMAKSPTVRKELKGYFERMFDELETNQKYNFLVGKQQAFPSDRLTNVTKKHFPELDMSDLDPDDISYFNKASRMLENMDKDLMKEGMSAKEIKAMEDAPDRPIEQIMHDIFYDVAEIEGEMGKRSLLETREELPSQMKKVAYKEGDVITAEYDPSIIPYKKATKAKEQSHNLERLLSQVGKFEGVGKEKGTIRNGISKVVSDMGSTRYLYTIDGETVSAIQVMTRDGKSGVIANAYTMPNFRNKGIAKNLIKKAEADFKTLEHSEDLTEMGEALKASTKIVKKAKAKLDPKLYATHRTNINNIARMLDEGVLPAPSFALAKSSKVSEQFGDIIMIPKEKHIDPKKGAYAFGGDAWTPRVDFDANAPMEIIDLKAPVFDRYPQFKQIAKNAYDGKDFYNMILNEERTVKMLEHWGKARGNDAYDMAQIAQDQIFKIEKPSLKKKIAHIKKLIKDNGGDIRGLEDAFTPSYIDKYKQYYNLEDVAKRGKELKTFKDKDKFYSEAEKAIAKGEQPPADYMESKRIDLVSLDDLDRIVVPADYYDKVKAMFKDKDLKVNIVRQRKGESTNSAIKRSSLGKSNFIYGGAGIGLIPLFDKKESN